MANDEFPPQNKIKAFRGTDFTTKSNEKRVGATFENFAPSYTAYPSPFPVNVSPRMDDGNKSLAALLDK